jgi:hypothetical protein
MSSAACHFEPRQIVESKWDGSFFFFALSVDYFTLSCGMSIEISSQRLFGWPSRTLCSGLVHLRKSS